MKLIALGANLAGAAHAGAAHAGAAHADAAHADDGPPPQATLAAALDRLDAAGVRIAARSRWWRSPAFPAGSGPDYVNAAARVETPLEPAALLAVLHRVEAELGRTRSNRWEPRVCDLDLIAWDGLILPDPATQGKWMALPPAEQARRAPGTLILPHPRMQDRGFVLAPLAEIAPDWRHPALGLTVAELLARLPGEALAGLLPMEPFPDSPG